MKSLVILTNLLLSIALLASCGGDDSSAKQLDHAGRVKYQSFWNQSVGDLAMVLVCTNYAIKAAANGDPVEASGILAEGKKFADRAKDETLNPPDPWSGDEVGSGLYSAASSLSDAMDKLRDYLDTGHPSDITSAQDNISDATSSVQSATDAAKESYKRMGGHASDLETLQNKTKDAISAFDTLMKSSSGSQ